MVRKNPILIERRCNLYSHYNYKIQIYAHFTGALLRSDAMKDFVYKYIEHGNLVL